MSSSVPESHPPNTRSNFRKTQHIVEKRIDALTADCHHLMSTLPNLPQTASNLVGPAIVEGTEILEALDRKVAHVEKLLNGRRSGLRVLTTVDLTLSECEQELTTLADVLSKAWDAARKGDGLD